MIGQQFFLVNYWSLGMRTRIKYFVVNVIDGKIRRKHWIINIQSYILKPHLYQPIFVKLAIFHKNVNIVVPRFGIDYS